MTMRWRRAGGNNRTRVGRVKYFKYTVEGKEVYIKEKAYVAWQDGWIDSQYVQKRTWNNAVKRGDTCIEISIEENLSETPITYLAMTYSSIYKLDKSKVYKQIEKVMKKIKEIKKESKVSPLAEYKIFKSLLEKELDEKIIK